jgi:hypothetical protein
VQDHEQPRNTNPATADDRDNCPTATDIRWDPVATGRIAASYNFFATDTTCSIDNTPDTNRLPTRTKRLPP